MLQLLPEDERVAYEVGHRIIKAFLSIPQVRPTLLAVWMRLVSEEGKLLNTAWHRLYV